MEFENKNDIQSLIKNLKITLILIKLQSGDFEILYFWLKVIFDQKFKLNDENWVGIRVNIVIFDHRTPIIPK